MKIISDQITIQELKDMAEKMFGSLVKAVVDIEKKVMAVDAELHSDLNGLLIENGSKKENTWGINIYPDKEDENLIEFDSMINLKPASGNKTRDIEDQAIREKIIKITDKIIKR